MLDADDLPAECIAWLAEVDRVMKRDWFIDSTDAGWSAEDCLRYWRYEESPEPFVDWFAEKYGLIRFDRGPVIAGMPSAS